MREGLCFYSERQCLLWRGGAQTTDSGSQGERACHCLASLCSINACHTWKDNSATWLTFQQGNDQLLLSNPEGKRLFLSSDSSSWKLLFLSACFFHLFLENTEELEVDFLVFVCLCWNPVFLKGLWEVSVYAVRLWGGREKKGEEDEGEALLLSFCLMKSNCWCGDVGLLAGLLAGVSGIS